MTALALCLPVVTLVGSIGAVPDDGAWERWCGIDDDRWTLGEQSSVDIVAACAPHSGQFSWEWDQPETATAFRAVSLATEEPLDLRGLRIFLRILPGSGDFSSWTWALGDAAGASYDWGIDVDDSLSGEGELYIGVLPSDLPGRPAGFVGEMGPPYRWLAFRFAADGSSVDFQHSPDCDVWTTHATFERPPGFPPLGASITQAMILSDGGAVEPERSPWALSSIYIETPGAGSEPAPES